MAQLPYNTKKGVVFILLGICYKIYNIIDLFCIMGMGCRQMGITNLEFNL